MKQRAPRTHHDRSGGPAPAAVGPAPQHAAPDAFGGSARQVAQRERLQAAFGPETAQRQAVRQAAPEEEEMLQGRRHPAAGAPVQRDVAEDEEEALQGHRIAGTPALQRDGLDEEEPLQGRVAGAPQPVAPQAGPGMAAGGLPPALQAGIERLSGLDISDVRVHAGSSAPARVGAHAFAQGPHIHLAPGQDAHLPHEAWHVVQQRQGRVLSTRQVNGVPVNDDPALEAEADVMGDRANRPGAAGPGPVPRTPTSGNGPSRTG